MLPLRFPRFWLFSGLGMMLLVLGLSLVPSNRVATLAVVSDKTSHFLAYVILMLWFCGVFRLSRTPWVALGLLCFGVLIEVLQSFLPYRIAEYQDLLADILGILAGWGLAFAGLRHWSQWVEARLPGARAP